MNRREKSLERVRQREAIRRGRTRPSRLPTGAPAWTREHRAMQTTLPTMAEWLRQHEQQPPRDWLTRALEAASATVLVLGFIWFFAAATPA